MRIHTDDNGVAVNAISQTAAGADVEGRLYQVLAGDKTVQLEFQTGAVRDQGVNGLTTEALLAALIHRTKVLSQRVPCDENAAAIINLEHALFWLDKRTRDRKDRQVEGLAVA